MIKHIIDHTNLGLCLADQPLPPSSFHTQSPHQEDSRRCRRVQLEAATVLPLSLSQCQPLLQHARCWYAAVTVEISQVLG
jgi:hypothetical protein